MGDTGYNRDRMIARLGFQLERMNNLKELELEMKHFGMDKETFEKRCKKYRYGRWEL